MSRRTVLSVEAGTEPGSLSFSLCDPKRSEPAAVATGQSAEAGLDALWSALGGRGPGLVDVQLHAPVVQWRTLHDLPPVRERDLVSLVREQRDRFFRRTSEHAVVAARWARDGDGERVAEAAVVGRDMLTALKSGLRRRGTRVARFLAVGAASSDGLSLLTPAMEARRARRTTRHLVGAALLVLAGWAAPAVTYVADLVLDDRAIRTELADLQTTLVRIDSLETRVGSFTPVASAQRRQGPESAWAARTLAEVAQGLPAGLHLHSLSAVRGGDVTLETHSDGVPDAATAVQRLWPGRTRVVGDPTSTEPFTLTLEQGS